MKLLISEEIDNNAKEAERLERKSFFLTPKDPNDAKCS